MSVMTNVADVMLATASPENPRLPVSSGGSSVANP